MAVKLAKDGFDFTFDNPEEAAKFFKSFSNGHSLSSNKAFTPQELSASNFRSFMQRLHKSQKKLVKAMLTGKEMVTDAELLESMKLDNNRELGGILAGISRNAKKSGFSIEALWKSETRHSETGKRSKAFLTTENFRQVAKEAGEVK